MLSAFPAMPSADGLFGIQLPALDGAFTPWECQEPLFAFEQQEPAFLSNKPQEPDMSNSGSDVSNPKPVSSNSGSDEPNRNNNNNSGSGSDEPNRKAVVIDERKRRRMISNRESARRSRMRKQKHLENLRNQVNRLKVGNRELMNRLRLVTHHSLVVQRDNDRLQSESVILREKLWAAHQVLLVRELQQFSPSAWPCNTITPFNQQTPPSSYMTNNFITKEPPTKR